MTGQTFLALLRKDWRVYRVLVLATVSLGVLPYAVSIATSGPATLDLLTGNVRSASALAHKVDDGAFLGIGVTVLLAAAFGGTAFAAERRDRSAEFVGLLPPGRVAALASKAVIAVACVGASLAVHLSLLGWADRLIAGPRPAGGLVVTRPMVAEVAATTAMLFGLAWCLSAGLTSPAICATGAVAVAAVTAVGLGEAGVFADRDAAAACWAMVAFGTGAAAFVAGSIAVVARVRL